MLLFVSIALANNVTIQALTDAPIQVGVRVTAEGPYRLRVSTGVGVLPAAYVDVINATCTSAGWYDEVTASLISASLENALVWRTHLGWRPFARHGFQFEGGYALVALGGGVTGPELIEALTGQSVPEDSAGERSFALRATVHQADVSAGWEWVIRGHLVLRADLGGAFTLAARTDVEPEFELQTRLGEAAVDAMEIEAETTLDETLVTWVHSPTVGLGVGWRF